MSWQRSNGKSNLDSLNPKESSDLPSRKSAQSCQTSTTSVSTQTEGNQLEVSISKQMQYYDDEGVYSVVRLLPGLYAAITYKEREMVKSGSAKSRSTSSASVKASVSSSSSEVGVKVRSDVKSKAGQEPPEVMRIAKLML
ncbi:hypothetical protein Pmani_033745 [Petrolisthes manimaculis]|uniref:Uncharacterized protein n=1 Tax=Petrolisthes manimaculis TaxID=1843537 RepID=A0AAE1TQD6_9EUCA|nr:hypothetical protein Pmani_033745 [Petrolisthes manimaculis]